MISLNCGGKDASTPGLKYNLNYGGKDASTPGFEYNDEIIQELF